MAVMFRVFAPAEDISAANAGYIEPILKTNDHPHSSYEKAKADGLLG